MTLTWKPQEERYGGGESAFGIDFREEHPELAELLSENGLYKHGMSCSDGKYQYTAKVVQNGKYVFVTRKLASNTKASPPKPGNGDEGWKKGHEENVKMHQESMKITQALIDAINENTRQQKENAIILDQIRMHTETLAADSTKKNAFADGTGKKVESRP